MMISPFDLIPFDPETLVPIWEEPGRVGFRAGWTELWVEAWGPRVLRLRLGSPPRTDYGLLVAQPSGTLALEALGEGWRVRGGEVALELQLRPFRVAFLHGEAPRLRPAEDGHIRGGLRLPPLARGEGWWGTAWALESGEPVYGLGEKWGPLDRRGGLFLGWNEDAWGVNAEASYKNVPLVWSPRGWGLFAHTPARTVHGVGYAPWSHRSYILLVEEEGLDLFFLAGTPEEILGEYTRLTGRPPLLPRWSYGVWWSRCYYRTAEEALEVARTLREREIPGDVLVLDGRAWLRVGTRCALEWDSERYPEPEAFVRALKVLGFRLCLWEYPYVSVHNPLFSELAQRGFFLRDRYGEPYIYRWDPEPFGELLTPLPPSGILDFTREEVVRWWQERHRALFVLGVDVMKTDFGEQVPEDAVAANGDTGRRLHNAYALLYNRAVFEVSPEGLVLARSGYAGSQRYPIHWGGDPQADWEGLAASLRGGLSWGLSGGAYYAHDIGGFYGTPSPELYVRWAQAGVFFSHLRFHGTTPREPWAFGREAERIVRAWLRFRLRLLPLLEAISQEACLRGLPLARALPLAYPEDPWARSFDTEFLLGDLLVAPVVRPGGEVEVYLPSGAWRDLWTGHLLEGPDLLRLRMSLERIPLFLKEGASLPLARPALRAEESEPEGVLLAGDGQPLGLPLLFRLGEDRGLGDLLGL